MKTYSQESESINYITQFTNPIKFSGNSKTSKFKWMQKEKLQVPPIYNSISPITHTSKIANINNCIITHILIANHYKRSLKSCLKKKEKDLMTVGFQYKLMDQKTME